MANHRPPAGIRPLLVQYQGVTEVTLDDYKHGDITEAEALQRFERAAAIFTDGLRAAYLIRMRNLEAFHTPKGRVIGSGGRA